METEKKIEKLEAVQLVKIYEQLIWIEEDIFGSCHVMVKHDVENAEPFCYCSFNYDYRYNSVSGVKNLANEMAIRLGAKEPVERTQRPFEHYQK